MAIQLSDLARVCVSTHAPYFITLPWNNNVLIDFAQSHYANLLGDGPEQALSSGLLPIVPPEGGWDKLSVVTDDGDDATEMTEFGAPGPSMSITDMEAEPGIISVWIPVELSGFAQDRINTRPTEYQIGWVRGKFVNAFKKLGDKINSLLLGSTANGLIGVIDDTVAYGGIDPAVVTLWASYVEKTGGVVSQEILDNVWYNVTGASRYASETDLVWLSPGNQIKRVKNIGDMLTVNSAMVKYTMADGRVLELGTQNVSYNQPFIRVPGMSTTDIVLLNTRGAHIQEVRSLQVVEKPTAGDGVLYYVAWRGKLVIPEKARSGKAEGLTA